MSIKKMDLRKFNVYLGSRTTKIEAIKYTINDNNIISFFDETHRKIASFIAWDKVLVEGAEIE